MMHHDALYSPTVAQQGVTSGAAKRRQAQHKAVVNQAQHIAFLEEHPYKEYEQDEIKQV